jgi:hypothetical protein
MRLFMRFVLGLFIVLLMNTLPAFADRGGYYYGHGGHYGGHGSFGVVIGPGWWWPGFVDPYPYYPYYPYYPQPPVVVQETPDIFIQPPAKAKQIKYWYFCPDPIGYYPDVGKCPKGWLKVVAPDYISEDEE